MVFFDLLFFKKIFIKKTKSNPVQPNQTKNRDTFCNFVCIYKEYINMASRSEQQMINALRQNLDLIMKRIDDLGYENKRLNKELSEKMRRKMDEYNENTGSFRKEVLNLNANLRECQSKADVEAKKNEKLENEMTTIRKEINSMQDTLELLCCKVSKNLVSDVIKTRIYEPADMNYYDKTAELAFMRSSENTKRMDEFEISFRTLVIQFEKMELVFGYMMMILDPEQHERVLRLISQSNDRFNTEIMKFRGDLNILMDSKIQAESSELLKPERTETPDFDESFGTPEITDILKKN